MAILIVYPLSIAAQGIDDIIKSLKNVECYESTVKYQVLMSLQADVSYTVKLNSMNAPGDSLAPCDYLINWSLATPDGESTGFSAYYDGNAYNFRGGYGFYRVVAADGEPVRCARPCGAER